MGTSLMAQTVKKKKNKKKQKTHLRCSRPGFNPWVRKNPLEKGMITHSSILAWRIPWIEEPGRLQSMGLQRVRND